MCKLNSSSWWAKNVLCAVLARFVCTVVYTAHIHSKIEMSRIKMLCQSAFLKISTNILFPLVCFINVESTFVFKDFPIFPVFWLTIGYVVKLPSKIINFTHFTPTYIREYKYLLQGMIIWLMFLKMKGLYSILFLI